MARSVAKLLAKATTAMQAQKAPKATPAPRNRENSGPEEDEFDAFVRIGLAMDEENLIPDPLGRHREPKSIHDHVFSRVRREAPPQKVTLRAPTAREAGSQERSTHHGRGNPLPTQLKWSGLDRNER